MSFDGLWQTGQYSVSLRMPPWTLKSFENSPWQTEHCADRDRLAARPTGAGSVTANADDLVPADVADLVEDLARDPRGRCRSGRASPEQLVPPWLCFAPSIVAHL